MDVLTGSRPIYSIGRATTSESSHRSKAFRQGDPLVPLLFSLGIRQLLDDLQTFLGPDHIIMAYLDDVYVLGPGPDILATVNDFFSSQTTGLALNLAKCSVHSLDYGWTNGLEILGFAVGPRHAREAFLRFKVG